MFSGWISILSPSKMDPPPVCNEHEFNLFFKARAYDIIGEGSFRKHMTECKDAGDPWAVEMSQGIHAVSSVIKNITLRVGSVMLLSPQIGTMCKTVMMGSQPPMRINICDGICSITNQRCTQCLSLPSGKRGIQTFVHARFCRFFMLLWVVAKIEYVIRCYVRSWMQTRENVSLSFETLAGEISELDPVVNRLYHIFVGGVGHVGGSLDGLMKTQRDPVIHPVDVKEGV